MKILVITGSPHKNGTTAKLAEELIRGATEKGHQVARFDAAFKEVHPCIACEQCHNGKNGCVFKDDMAELNPQLLAADAIVFVSPIYYFGMNAQIRTVIDRFYANDYALHKNKRTALLVALADTNTQSAQGAITSFEEIARFMEWEIVGEVVAVGCGDPSMLRRTNFLEKAYQLGQKL